MQKQLNPQLFGMQTSPRGIKGNFSEDFSSPTNDTPQRNDATQAMLDLNDKVEKIQRQLLEFHAHVSQNTFQTEENLKALRAKGDRQQLVLNRMESEQDALTIETSQKIHFLQQKHTEQKKLEDSVQSLIDRQNNLLKGYEVRLNQMQKLLADKEAQMISTLAALNETKAELQRIKRLP